MSTFDMNTASDRAFKMNVYAIYLRKLRADLEAEKLGEGETIAPWCYFYSSILIYAKSELSRNIDKSILWRNYKMRIVWKIACITNTNLQNIEITG